MNAYLYLFIFLRFYLFIHERQREREAETQAEGEAGSALGAPCGTRFPTGSPGLEGQALDQARDPAPAF